MHVAAVGIAQCGQLRCIQGHALGAGTAVAEELGAALAVLRCTQVEDARPVRVIGVHLGAAGVTGQGKAELAVRLQWVDRPQRFVDQPRDRAGQPIQFQPQLRIAAGECTLLHRIGQAQRRLAQPLRIGRRKEVVDDDEGGRHGHRA